MPFAPRNSVRVQLTIIILATIVCSWLLSAGLSNYLHYQRVRSMRQHMLEHPEFYPVPIPEPQFGWKGFFLGPRAFMPTLGANRPSGPAKGQPLGGENKHSGGAQLLPSPMGGPPFGVGDRPNRMPLPPGLPPRGRLDPWFGSFLLSRAGIALFLALAAGTWLSYRFTRPLGELIKGAMAFQSGNLNYRVPLQGESDFTQVASAMNRMAEQLRLQIEELKKDAARRKQLLADVAHELRGPVTTMQTMCTAMASGLAEQPERRQQAMESLARAADRLTRLVTDLLELAKLDLKELPIHFEEVELRELLTTVLQNHAAMAKQHQVILRELKPGSLQTVLADPYRLTQILDNLINNAISHTGAGTEIQVSIVPGDPIEIRVADTGKGIAAEHLPYLFDPFYRVDQARSPGDFHCGLGLRIARGLAEAHHGQLHLTSQLEEGTTAILRLPRAPVSQAEVRGGDEKKSG